MAIGAAPWALSLGGCRSCLPRSDAERAREEREEAKQRIESSLTLVPYRLLKTVLRARNVTPPPPEFAELAKQVEALQFQETTIEWAVKTQQVATLIASLYRARALLRTVDEDRFPLLWAALVNATLPMAAYDAPAEHLLLATAMMAIDVALNKDPITEVLLYELSRATAKDSWPPELKLWSQAARGLMYMVSGYHYAAEEELTAYLATVPALGAQALQVLQHDDPQRLQGLPLLMLFAQTPVLLAAGYLMRAINRFGLGGRSEAAYDDLEAMLHQLGAAGIDNELSQWGWAMVHIHRQHYKEAGVDLDRLAQSPYLSPDDQAEVRSCSQRLSGLNKGFVLFGAQRAQLLILRALIARAGGVLNILTKLLGAEQAAQVYAPLAFLTLVANQLQTGVQGTVKQGEELGNKGLNFIREQLKRRSQRDLSDG